MLIEEKNCKQPEESVEWFSSTCLMRVQLPVQFLLLSPVRWVFQSLSSFLACFLRAELHIFISVHLNHSQVWDQKNTHRNVSSYSDSEVHLQQHRRAPVWPREESIQSLLLKPISQLVVCFRCSRFSSSGYQTVNVSDGTTESLNGTNELTGFTSSFLIVNLTFSFVSIHSCIPNNFKISSRCTIDCLSTHILAISKSNSSVLFELFHVRLTVRGFPNSGSNGDASAPFLPSPSTPHFAMALHILFGPFTGGPVEDKGKERRINKPTCTTHLCIYLRRYSWRRLCIADDTRRVLRLRG